MTDRKKYSLLLFAVIIVIITAAIVANKWRNNVEFNKITISGNYTISREEILKFAKLYEDSSINIEEINLKMIQDRISKYPEIKKVSVSKEPPAELKIVVTEKRPVALLNIENELKLIDEDLEVFPFKNYQKIYDLPVITGYSTSKTAVVDSMKNVNNLRTALFIILNAYQKSKTLYNMISEINIADSSKIIVFSNEKSAQFYFPKYKDKSVTDKIYQKELNNTLVKFNAFQLQTGNMDNIGYVDLRYNGQAIVKFN
ncbi:MAG TPA: FtsQ-type POTRA domain-containing protein [Ignavibacteria bacterium]